MPAEPPRATLPGDNLIPSAPVVWDREATLSRPPVEVWPWLVQLGKGRGGWYMPRSAERVIPPRLRAIRRVDPAYQGVQVGQRVPDYGPDGWFEARVVDPPHALVWWSQRRDLRYSWALVLEREGTGSRLRVRLRFSRRFGSRSPGVLEGAADVADHVLIALMFAGLRERLDGR